MYTVGQLPTGATVKLTHLSETSVWYKLCTQMCIVRAISVRS